MGREAVPLRAPEEADVDERLGKMLELGQAPWVDELSRDDTRNGGLQAMIEDGIVGVTSNPAIFQKAIANSDLYDDQLQELARETDDPKEMFWGIAGTDIQEACDVLTPVYEGSGGVDGYVSLEVQPDIAYDTQATIDEAEKLHNMVDRPNLFIKIPATLPGLVAIEEMISRGRSINVTLIFSLERYREVARAYIRGIERLVESGGDPSRVRSVASFFVSRIDAEADDRLEKLGREDLKGRLAIANAMPKKTIEAVKDHGEIQPVLTESLEDAVRLLDDLREAGLDYEEVTDILEKEGIQKFADPFNEMLDEIKNKGRQLVS